MIRLFVFVDSKLKASIHESLYDNLFCIITDM